ncbi:hypothetical protein B932_1545 [Gluconobacter oxydans H24]|uniref:Uncharacterized protein n=1 Tax=Gluconobacter thailandicus TaxID=257438 RepID=A0AAP9EQ14_GLUTH|nr:hypothetical protein B932_1545 [Gluconobacter oxydans H24]QEH95439.1 hypothetical protein FXF46_03595 [Gluconobacter thailandicus]
MLQEREFRQIRLRFLILPDMTPAILQATYKKDISQQGNRHETIVLGMRSAPAYKLCVSHTFRHVGNCRWQ